MNNIDYKIFVPRGENNSIKFDKEEITVDKIHSININLEEDQLLYWIYFRINDNDHYHKHMLKKNKTLNMILLLGNNPYEIYGKTEVVSFIEQKWEKTIEFAINFIVTNASNTINNPRKEVNYERSELLDLSKK
jgi:hypothetical protein